MKNLTTKTKENILEFRSLLEKKEGEAFNLEYIVDMYNKSLKNSSISIEDIENEYFRLIFSYDNDKLFTFFGKKINITTALLAYTNVIYCMVDEEETYNFKKYIFIPTEELIEIRKNSKTEKDYLIEVYMKNMYYYIQIILELIAE